MENWDEAKLRDVVTQQGRKQTNATDVSVLLLVSPVEEGLPGVGGESWMEGEGRVTERGRAGQDSCVG